VVPARVQSVHRWDVSALNARRDSLRTVPGLVSFEQASK
jgi:hypothetical protein